MATARDRFALYYPYIHIRDVDWLKGTLNSCPDHLSSATAICL